MKFLVFFFVSFVALWKVAYSRECIYVEGQCVEDCPVGTRSYTTGCNRKTPEATCDEPNPVKDDYETCDFSSCYCISPTVRDTVSNKCVTLDKCPKKAKQAENEGKV